MSEPSSLSIEHCFCHNSDCPDHGKRGHGNVYFRGFSGRDKQIRMVYCRTCKRSYSQRKGTALERSQLPTDKVLSVLDHLREGCGVRATSRLTGRSKGAILLTSDGYPAYATAIEEVYGVWVQPERKPGPGRPPGPRRELPAGLVCATVCKKRQKGRVVQVIRAVVLGMWCLLDCWLRRSPVSNTINTSFVERNNATDRRQNGRKQRKTYGFSRDKRLHDAATYFVSYSYNFCWPVRTLRVKEDGAWRPRTPAMAAGLTDHVWSLREWLAFPAKPCSLV